VKSYTGLGRYFGATEVFGCVREWVIGGGRQHTEGIDSLWASLIDIRVVKWRRVRWVGVTAFSGLDEKSIKYLHRKFGKVDPTWEKGKNKLQFIYTHPHTHTHTHTYIYIYIYIYKAKGRVLYFTHIMLNWLTLVNTATKFLLPCDRRIYYIIRRLSCP